MKIPAFSTYKAVQFLPLMLVLGYFLYASVDFPLHDFSNAYFAAILLSDNLFSPAIYDALHFNQTISDLGYKGLYLAYYPNTPFLAFFFQPLTIFQSPYVAKFVYNLISAGLFVVAVYRLCRYYQLPAWSIIAAPFVFILSLRNNLYFGQVYFIVFFLLSMGFMAYESGQKWRTAMLWGLAIVLKVFPVLLCLLLLSKKDYPAFLKLMAACVFYILLSLWCMPLESWLYYSTEVFYKSNTGAYYDGFTAAAKSISMLFRNLFLYDAQYNPTPLYASSIAYKWVSTLFKVVLLSALFMKSVDEKNKFMDLVPLWLIGAMLLAPGWSSYAAIVLLFLYVYLWSAACPFSIFKKISISVLVLVYCNIPIQYFYDLALLLQFPKVYLLVLLFVGCMNQAISIRKVLKYGLVSLSVTAFLVCIIRGSAYDANSYALPHKTPLLLTDYYQKKDTLYYRYWDVEGVQTASSNKVISQFDSADISIVNHQIYYRGQQLTYDASLKRKPVLIDGHTIFYLSDKNRGMGFYTLMQLNLKPPN